MFGVLTSIDEHGWCKSVEKLWFAEPEACVRARFQGRDEGDTGPKKRKND